MKTKWILGLAWVLSLTGPVSAACAAEHGGSTTASSAASVPTVTASAPEPVKPKAPAKPAAIKPKPWHRTTKPAKPKAPASTKEHGGAAREHGAIVTGTGK